MKIKRDGPPHRGTAYHEHDEDDKGVYSRRDSRLGRENPGNASPVSLWISDPHQNEARLYNMNYDVFTGWNGCLISADQWTEITGKAPPADEREFHSIRRRERHEPIERVVVVGVERRIRLFFDLGEGNIKEVETTVLVADGLCPVPDSRSIWLGRDVFKEIVYIFHRDNVGGVLQSYHYFFSSSHSHLRQT